MKEQEKQLLFKELCARLPYGVIVRGVFIHYNKNKDKILYEECDNELNYTHLNRYESLKPYLRPMSSMTDEEDIRRCAFLDDIEGGIEDAIPNYIDWLNAHHFDYRDLIKKGLAIEAPEGMYNF